MGMEKLATVTAEGLRTDLPAIEPGDTVKVMVRVREGDKERLQAFEGIILAKKGGGINETFTVRKVSAGVGVERIFPLHSPFISKVVVRRGGETRRAKLFYLRDRVGKAVRLTDKKKTKKDAGPGGAPAPEQTKELAGAAAS